MTQISGSLVHLGHFRRFSSQIRVDDHNMRIVLATGVQGAFPRAVSSHATCW